MKREAVSARLKIATIICLISTLLRIILLNLDNPEDRLMKILRSDLLLFLGVLFVLIYSQFYACVVEHTSSIFLVMAAI